MNWLPIIVLYAGTSIDIGSSIGKIETNPILRTRTGEFSSGKYLALNIPLDLGFTYLYKKHPNSKPLKVMGVVVGGFKIGTGIRNFRE